MNVVNKLPKRHETKHFKNLINAGVIFQHCFYNLILAGGVIKTFGVSFGASWAAWTTTKKKRPIDFAPRPWSVQPSRAGWTHRLLRRRGYVLSFIFRLMRTPNVHPCTETCLSRSLGRGNSASSQVWWHKVWEWVGKVTTTGWSQAKRCHMVLRSLT